MIISLTMDEKLGKAIEQNWVTGAETLDSIAQSSTKQALQLTKSVPTMKPD